MPRLCGFFWQKPGVFQRQAAGSSGYKLHMACDTFPTSVNHHRGNPWEPRKNPPQKGGKMVVYYWCYYMIQIFITLPEDHWVFIADITPLMLHHVASKKRIPTKRWMVDLPTLPALEQETITFRAVFYFFEGLWSWSICSSKVADLAKLILRTDKICPDIWRMSDRWSEYIR